MKSLDFLKEGFVEDASEAHQDHEVQMARQECFHAAEHALALHKLLRNISEAQGLEGWVSSKITLANDYLQRVREYLEYELLTKDINDEAPALTIAEDQESKKKNQIVEYKVSGAELGSENYTINDIELNALQNVASNYYDRPVEISQSKDNPDLYTINVTMTVGPVNYGSYNASTRTASLAKRMTDKGDLLQKVLKGIAEGQSEEERAESERQMQDFLSKGGEIQQVRANRGPRRSGASLASHHIGGMGDARTGRRSQMRGLGSNPTGKLLVAKESEGVTEGKSVNDRLLELWINHGKAFNLLDYYTNASGNRKQIQKYKQIIDQLESRCEAEFGSKVCAAMKKHTDAMANSWYGQSNRSGELRAAKLRKQFGINWNGQLNESEQGESEGNNLELYGLKIGDTVKTEINGLRVQGDVIDIFPDKMEVELLLRGPNAGKTVTVDVRDTEALSEQGVAEGMEGQVVFSGSGADGGKYEIIQTGPTDFMIHANGKHIDTYSSLQRAMSVLRNEVSGLKKGVAEGSNEIDQQAHAIADKLTTGKNLQKLRGMAYDSTVYRALDRYFEKHNIPETIYNRVAAIVFQRINQQGVAEGFPHDVDHMPGKTVKHQSTNCTTCHGRKTMYKLGGKLFADNKKGATPVKCPTCKGTGDKQGVAEGAKCNHTMEGENCPVHGLKECGSYGKVEEMSAGSVATVVNPHAKNKSKVGTLFGGTYKQKKVKEAKQMTFSGENTKPPQRPGDQVRGTEKATKPNPFKHRLVGNE